MVHGFLGVLMKVLGIFLGFDFCPNSIFPVTWNPEYPPPPPSGCNVDTIYITIHQVSHSGYSSHADIGHQQQLPVRCPRVDAPDPSSSKRLSSPRVQADPTSTSNPTAESQARASHPVGQQPLSRSSRERRFSARLSTCRLKVL